MAKPASGMYKTKARNLTDAQLKRAKGAGAAAKRTVSVSATTRATTGANKGYTLGAGGKRLTGTVVMANGDRAVYKGGKRVTNVPKSAATKSGSSGGGSGKTVTKATGMTLAQKAMAKNNSKSSGMGGSTSSSSGKTVPTGGQKTAGSRYAAQVNASKPSTASKSGYSLPGGFTIPSGSKASTPPKKSGPQKGDRRRVSGPYGGEETYNGSRWVKS